MDQTLLHAFIYLAATVVAVPVAKRLGLGSVLGYLVAGALIGPSALGLVGQGGDVMHFAEFGVVMMLFLVGLELQPSLLWRMRGKLLGLGGLQVTGTAGAICAIGIVCGVDWRVSLAAGAILAMSSTAIVLQSLQERGQMHTPAGESAFAVLLFQDIAVIPILALLPLLAVRLGEGGAHGEVAGEHAGGSLIAGLPGWGQALVVIGAVVVIIAAGRFLVNPLFRIIARTRLRELFTASALLLVIGVALLMGLVGMSAALGTFLAGVVLANSEFRHELEADIEPFKGLLLGLFFITVGAGIDFGLLGSQPGLIAKLVAGLFAVKALVLFALSRVFRLPTPTGLTFALILAQGGEFCFVLLNYVVGNRVLTAEQAAPLTAAVALSMALTPLLFLLNEKIVQPFFAQRGGSLAREADAIDPAEQENPVIIAGFGRFGHVIGRMLTASGWRATVLDLDPEHVEVIRRLNIKAFYGDATRLDLLQAAGAGHAKILVVAIDEDARAMALIETAQKHFPHLQIFARASGRVQAHAYQKLGGVEYRRETLGSAVDLGTDVLRALGTPAHQAHRAGLRFKRHDEASVRVLAKYWEDDDAYFSEARQQIAAFEQMFAADHDYRADELDRGWEPMPPPSPKN